MRCEDCGMTIGHNDECPRVAPDVIEWLKKETARLESEVESVIQRIELELTYPHWSEDVKYGLRLTLKWIDPGNKNAVV